MTRHVVLLTYGEPGEPAFGAQLRYSWRILLGLTRSVAPIPLPLLPVIALSRARLRRRLWTAERYGSPLEPITRDQATGLAAALGARAPGEEWRVHVAYEFRDPLLVTRLNALPAHEPVTIVPMYVADSAFTHELSRTTVQAWHPQSRSAPVRVLPALDPGKFAEIAADHVAAGIDARGIGGPDWALMLAAHGTLLDPPRPYETGRVDTEHIAAAISARLAPRFGRVAHGWLNHVYGGRWTEPPVEQALRDLAAAGYRRIVYFPFGFLADNAESQLEGRIALRAHAWEQVAHLPCLNDAPGLMRALADQVLAESGIRQAGAAAPREPHRNPLLHTTLHG